MFDGAGAEKAGDKGMLIASVTAIAIEACFAGGNILNSILKLARGRERVWIKHVGERGKQKWLSAICEGLAGFLSEYLDVTTHRQTGTPNLMARLAPSDEQQS